MCYAVMEEPSFKTVLMDPKVSIEAGWDTKMGLDIQRKVLICTFMSGVIYDQNIFRIAYNNLYQIG